MEFLTGVIKKEALEISEIKRGIDRGSRGCV